VRRLFEKGPTRNFLLHLLEMTAAMFIGMGVLAWPAHVLFDALGWHAANEQIIPRTLVMATNMSIGMAVWMRVRGCHWRATGEMCLAMYLAFVPMYPLFLAGWISEGTVMVVGHVLMVPAMAVAMLFRLDMYTRSHHGHGHVRETDREHVNG
jgi:hypothetical protein